MADQHAEEPDIMMDLEAYPAQMRAVLISLTGTMPAEDLDFVGDLVDYGEGGEAMLALANMMVERDAKVPAATIREIRELADGFIRPDEFPAHFDEQAVDDSEQETPLSRTFRFRST